MSMSGSVSHWIHLLQAGDQHAADLLWQRYCDRLVRLARRRLGRSPRTVSDEDDVANDAFASFCRRAASGHFPQLLDRDNLWRLLVVLTERKADRTVRDQRRQKRGGGRVVSERALDADKAEGRALDQLPGREPTPEFAAQVAEECERLLGLLDPPLRAVAVWKMEGYANAEIAARLGCIERTVERKLGTIRQRWEEERPA